MLAYVFRVVLATVARRSRRRFDATLADAARINEQALRRILRRQAQTEFGRQHRFGEIARAADVWGEYRRSVPLSVYTDYESAIARMVAGERNVLTRDRPLFFALSSGTTGSPKTIPVTTPALQRSLNAMLLSHEVLARFRPAATTSRGISLLRMSSSKSTTPDGTPIGDASAFGMRRAVWCLPWLYTTPRVAFDIADKPTALFVHLVFALRAPDFDHVSATFANYILQFFRTLEDRWPQLLETIATGRLPPDLVLSTATRAELERRLRPDPQLAERLRPEFAAGMHGIARRVWPRVSAVAAVCTGSFAHYVPAIREYVGDATICSLLYGTTESPVAINLDPQRPREYVLIPGAAAFEFIPVDDDTSGDPSRTVRIDELRTDRQYEVVVSNYSGFYRYRIGDVVRVVGMRDASPIVEFDYRRGMVIDLAAEKMTEQQIAHAVTGLRTGYPELRVVDYTVAADVASTPPRYRVFMEAGGVTNPGAAQSRAQRCLDAGLSGANVDYAILRRDRGIGEPRVDFVGPGTFEALLEQARRGRLPNVNTLKVPRLVRDKSQLEFLESRCLKV